MSEPPTARSNPSTHEPKKGLYVPRWVLVALLLLLALPFLMMATMMLGMGLMGPPMHGGMEGHGTGVFWVAGFFPLLVIGVGYGVYRVTGAEDG